MRVVASFIDSKTLLFSVSYDDSIPTWKTTITLVTETLNRGFSWSGEDRLMRTRLHAHLIRLLSPEMWDLDLSIFFFLV